MVTRDDLEADLRTLADADPVAGVFGPRSMTWQVARESVVLFAGGRAALLQLAHPWVAQAIAQHSMVFDDLALRFRRTLSTMYAMTFGTRDDALRLARRIHTLHTTVRGTLSEDAGAARRGDAYQANDHAAMLWVAATLWDSSIDLFQRTIRPLTEDELAQYWREARTLCCLFGFSSMQLPRDWPDFCRYRDGMLASDTLAVSNTTRTIARGILTPPRPSAEPLFRWIRILTAGLLPERFRQAFDLPFGPVEKAAFATSITTLRLGLRRLPGSLRFTPGYLQATRRVAGRGGTDPVAATLRRLILTLLQKERTRPTPRGPFCGPPDSGTVFE